MILALSGSVRVMPWCWGPAPLLFGAAAGILHVRHKLFIHWVFFSSSSVPWTFQKEHFLLHTGTCLHMVQLRDTAIWTDMRITVHSNSLPSETQHTSYFLLILHQQMSNLTDFFPLEAHCNTVFNDANIKYCYWQLLEKDVGLRPMTPALISEMKIVLIHFLHWENSLLFLFLRSLTELVHKWSCI